MGNRFTHPDDAYVLTIPDGWEVEELSHTHAFFHPDTGVGAVNISVMSPKPEMPMPLAKAIIGEFIPRNATIEGSASLSAQSNELNRAFAKYSKSSKAWRLWVICGQTRIVVVTYNCDQSREGIEDEQVDALVASIRAA